LATYVAIGTRAKERNIAIERSRVHLVEGDTPVCKGTGATNARIARRIVRSTAELKLDCWTNSRVRIKALRSILSPPQLALHREVVLDVVHVFGRPESRRTSNGLDSFGVERNLHKSATIHQPRNLAYPFAVMTSTALTTTTTIRWPAATSATTTSTGHSTKGAACSAARTIVH